MRSPKLRRFLILCAISAVAAIACSSLIHALALNFGWDALPLLYQIPMGLLLGTLFTVLPMVAVALIVLGVTVVIPRWRKRSLQQSMGIIIGFYSVFLCHMVASATTSQLITWRQIHRVEAFSDRLIPQIEAYKTRHGYYPENLDDLKPSVKRPHFLRDSDWYYQKNVSGGYELSYANPWSFAFWYYSYDSTRGEWISRGSD